MSTEDYTSDRTDAESDHPPKGTDLQADLIRVGRVVATAVSQGREHDDQFLEKAAGHADDLADWIDDQEVSTPSAIAAAWFFLLGFADE